MTGESANVIYPQYCFHLSPTIEKWCRFRASDIHGLTSHRGFEGQDLYFHLNHPIKWVQVAGVVVAIDEFYGKRSYTVDDSSGATIECLLNVPKESANLIAISKTAAEGTVPKGKDNKYVNKAKTASAESATTREEVRTVVDGDIDVGDVLLVKGNITVFRNNKQIRVYRISHLRYTGEEVQFWKKMTEFYDHVLSQPWLLGEKELRRCRKAATRSGDAEPSDQKRRKRKAGGSTRTGLEKSAVQPVRPVKPSADAKGPRLTGLEKASKLAATASVEPASIPMTAKQLGNANIPRVRVTGLEKESKPGLAVGLESTSISKTRKRPEAPVADERPPQKAKVTGLERTTTRSTAVTSSSVSIQSAATVASTADSVRPSKRRVTGLERGIQQQESDGSQVAASYRTRTELPSSNDRGRARKTKVTGLERMPKRPVTRPWDRKPELDYEALGI